jgi:malonyl-CoA/methylmalonyl-CoA synthetase
MNAPSPSSVDPVHWIETHAATNPKSLWLIDARGSETYADLMAAVLNMAGRLVALGTAPGDRVAAKVEKSREALHLYLACLWLGAIYLPLNAGYTDAEIDYFLMDAEPRLFIVPLQEVRAEHPTVRVETLGETGDGSLLNVSASPVGARVQFPSETIAAILYTSGTTGKPKGAMLTRGNLASSAATLVDAWQFTHSDVLIHALPIFHVHGLFVATNCILAAGASMHLLPKFDPDAVIALFDRASVLMGVPTFYTRLLASPKLTKAVVASMRLFISGSAPLLAETYRAFSAQTGHFILERYGMTETMMNTSNPYDGPRLPGTVGPPLKDVRVRVVDPDTGAALPHEEIGMIEVSGPNVFSGYWRNPEKTAQEFRDDGYFITGDLGKIDGAGYVHIIGRGKDLIISGGLNIYPKEVEDAIDAVPGVIESAVIGVPHPDFGEAVVAIIVANGLNAQEIARHLAKSLARFKLPKALRFVEELPRNAMGKVQKTVLRSRYQKIRFD